jgi:hypothetical protein
MRSCTATPRAEVTRVPCPAGPYRGIRANMEQASICTGLDHCLDYSGKGIAALRRSRSRAAGSGLARFVIPAGSAGPTCRSASGDRERLLGPGRTACSATPEGRFREDGLRLSGIRLTLGS